MPLRLLDDVLEEDHQVRLIKTRLDELAAERSTLLRQLNSIRTKTRVFPPEILSQIFIMSATPLRLGAVCSLWREVAWSTPELWATIKCNPKQRPHRSVTSASLYLLRLFFKNSGQLKVAVELVNISCWHMSSGDQPGTIRKAMAIIAKENHHRIRTLVFRSFQPWDARIWKVVHPFFQTQYFPHLESLHLLGYSAAPLVLQNAPHLRQLSLSKALDILLPRNQPYWNQITAIRLETTMSIYCFNVLHSPPPRLEVFECVDAIYKGVALLPSAVFTPVTILPRLTDFEWTGRLGLFQGAMWKGIRLPAIRRFTWNCPCPLAEISIDLQRDFFKSLSTLETLKIQQYHSIVELRVVLECLDSLCELELDACKLEVDGVDVMEVLTLFDNDDDDRRRPNLLPNLKKLKIEVLVGRGISGMLRSRREQRSRSVESRLDQQETGSRLEKAVIHMEDVIYEPGEQEVLRALVAGGLRLDMVVGDEAVKWS